MEHTHSILKTLGYVRIAPAGYPHVAHRIETSLCVFHLVTYL